MYGAVTNNHATGSLSSSSFHTPDDDDIDYHAPRAFHGMIAKKNPNNLTKSPPQQQQQQSNDEALESTPLFSNASKAELSIDEEGDIDNIVDQLPPSLLQDGKDNNDSRNFNSSRNDRRSIMVVVPDDMNENDDEEVVGNIVDQVPQTLANAAGNGTGGKENFRSTRNDRMSMMVVVPDDINEVDEDEEDEVGDIVDHLPPSLIGGGESGENSRKNSSTRQDRMSIMVVVPDDDANDSNSDNITSDVGMDDDIDHFSYLDDENLLDPSNFELPTSPDDGHRAKALKLSSFSRPHMRAFHGSWMCWFASFFIWFAFSPLLPELKRSLDLSSEDIWLSNIWNVSGAVVVRLLLGPLCDKYGARSMMTGLLALCSIFCLASGLVTNLGGLILVRTLVGLVGGNFVAGQCWTSSHFTRDVGGTAMALAAGWGAMGGGIAQVFMGSVIFPLAKYLLKEGDPVDVSVEDEQLSSSSGDLAWRLSFIPPSLIALSVAIYFRTYSDDCPLGNFVDVKKAGLMMERSAVDSFRSGVLNFNSWILFFQFAASLGAELTMESGVALYFHERFDKSVEEAAAMASLFGLTNLFARGLGGYLSDLANRHYSLRGRLLVHMLFTLGEGCFILLFGGRDTLTASVISMAFFSVFTQMSMGTCFSLVPYIDPQNTGSIAGVVGAGGNVGAILFGSVFRSNTFQYSFDYMGMFAIIMACLTPLIVVKGYKGILFGKEMDRRRLQAALLVPT